MTRKTAEDTLHKTVCRVEGVSKEGGECVLLTLDAPEIAKLAVPGQFVMVKCTDGACPLLRRPISIASAREDKIFLLVQPVGTGTRWLCERKAGDSIDVIGPLGNGFTLPGAGENILVSGGLGAPPLLFLARILADMGKQAVSLLGAGSSSRLVLKNEMAAVCKDVFISTEDGSEGTKGLVTDLVSKLAPKSTANIFACGPLPMLARVAEIAEKASSCQVSLEAKMACGYGACMGCAVPAANGGYLHVCTQGPVFPSKLVMWRNPL
ncbi:MAG: dihydroorotate dehydrogenase electron transfer subunit [Deltaproteobacteria bacterium]|nr:dihydroorotate dehydrogenase electron transfer subunit [Deltaproteobacteria bacterium]